MELHHDQCRKGTTIPYITHLWSVAAIVGEHGGTEEQVIAALLHDAIEDQGDKITVENIRERFGQRVAEIVKDCSDADTIPSPLGKNERNGISTISNMLRRMSNSYLLLTSCITHEPFWGIFESKERPYGNASTPARMKNVGTTEELWKRCDTTGPIVSLMN